MPPRQGNLAVRINCRGTPYAVGQPLSSEKRQMILQMHLAGQQCNQISTALDVTHGLVSKLVRRFKQTGSMDPRPRGAPRRLQKREGQQQSRYTQDQLAALQAVYDVRRYPLPQDLERLTSETGLARCQLRTWFSNRRYRSRPSASDTTDPPAIDASCLTAPSTEVTSESPTKLPSEPETDIHEEAEPVPSTATAPDLPPVPEENVDENEKPESELASAVQWQSTPPAPIPVITAADVPTLYADSFRLALAFCDRPLSMEDVLLCAKRADFIGSLMKLPALQRPTPTRGILSLQQCLEEIHLQVGLDKISKDLLVALYLSTALTS